MSGTELIDRLGNSVMLTEDPVAHTSSLAAEDRWAEVKVMTDFLVDRPDLADPRQIRHLAGQADVELSSFWKYARRFADGAVTGEPTDWTSMLGSLSLDLFVVGDIRDLAVQGWKQIYYGSGDPLIMALSAVGLTTTMAPQIDWAPALLKALKRTGALTKSFTKSLIRTSRTALRTGNYRKLVDLLSDMRKAAKSLGPGPLRGAMGVVDSADDLKKIAKAAEIDAQSTYVLTQLAGKNTVKRIYKDGKNVGVLATSLKVGSRLTKIADKSFGLVPTPWLLAVFVAALSVLAAALLPRRKRHAGRKIGAMESSTNQATGNELGRK